MKLRTVFIIVAVLSSCGATAAIAQEDAPLFSVHGKDLLSLLIAGVAPLGAVGLYLIKTLQTLNHTMIKVELRLETAEREQAICKSDRVEIRKEVVSVAKDASEGRSKIYSHIAAQMGHTPVR